MQSASQSVGGQHVTTTTRSGPSLSAELDELRELREQRDAYARVSAQAVLDGDELAAVYAAQFGCLNAEIA